MSWNKLVGMQLSGGWDIVSLQPKLAGGTGGNFSVQFLVQKAGQNAFMKAFDLDKLFRLTAGDPRIMQRELESINFEITLLELCQKANARGVVVPIEIGKVTVAGVNADQPIQYIIFELGQQDVRKYHSYRAAVDYITNFAILKHAASGLLELHSLEIAHQDLKPSNVVIFPGNVSRLADLGRSSHRPMPVWHDNGLSPVLKTPS